MRYISGALALGAALVLGSLATTAQAADAPVHSIRSGGLYAPTELVLTVGQGETRATATVERAVTLSCMPGATGSHPNPKAACAQLRSASGDFAKVTGTGTERLCTKIWNPVVVTADGVWEGRRVSYTYTYANSCMMNAAQQSVFRF
ncbi:subtilase-type protease inhibitor [Streptomyces gilvosporeus]|uniref:Probable subtilase-type protease inhibitor n=1 Tax=Streptomyces gilvosporeus TaxID=553510 RepID=A0A1V0TNV1_9ACTN|nr:subtilase-type protease inhibitor [Streptomyces gilvosporeus]ARF54611.1 protease inhibitor protein [Streptomyces gilvosporeus]